MGRRVAKSIANSARVDKTVCDGFLTLGTVEAPMTMGDGAELQRLARLVEANRERLQAIEQQIRNLESLRVEQTHAIEALDGISEDGAEGVMVPLGAGVQIIADIPADAGAVIDIGSRVQAEKTRGEATTILRTRNEELMTLMEMVKKEYDDLENHIITLANQFNDTVEHLQNDEEEEPERNTDPEKQPTPPKARRRRKRGTELTLDD
ncbi:MAG: prefoldin subunit alpha [Candidatus Thalassarchaeaceae archaeon]|jgi:prefoldin alpha subunit|nr:prefoldin subunit alpha [Actinomycetota bacterium]MDP6220047.1 prefoldin subunit alpha [Candidatus Thalassarchaeaceae archaeon]MDP7091300.1 prefoldin subunit alpha [Candidatus Thalassarchaeaceae archaeon]MDP7257537.1 prefoldin subunit alpha [Candidatus Thalassarchaeaceae archaeon]MDP7445789.1 prefoldin subunit alpha [Candidatus Thalassarchaeaceae archaeon]|tara:strand:+ start:956 stop:1579 length:624 start_codon:yes stop_codon:yes gene_type:complete